jgi:hypothetical protein
MTRVLLALALAVVAVVLFVAYGAALLTPAGAAEPDRHERQPSDDRLLLQQQRSI